MGGRAEPCTAVSRRENLRSASFRDYAVKEVGPAPSVKTKMRPGGLLGFFLSHPERSEGSRARERVFAGAGRRSVRRDSSLRQPSLRMTTRCFLDWVPGRARQRSAALILGAGVTPAYLPMQKSRKMASKTSSVLTSPVIDPSAAAAAMMSTATISGGISESAALRAFLSAPRAIESASR